MEDTPYSVVWRFHRHRFGQTTDWKSIEMRKIGERLKKAMIVHSKKSTSKRDKTYAAILKTVKDGSRNNLFAVQCLSIREWVGIRTSFIESYLSVTG